MLVLSKDKKAFEKMFPEVTTDIYQQSSNINGRLLSVCMHGVYCDSRHRSEVYVSLQ